MGGSGQAGTQTSHHPSRRDLKCSQKTKPVVRADGGGQSQAENQEFLSDTPQQVTPDEAPPCCTPIPYSKPPLPAGPQRGVEMRMPL